MPELAAFFLHFICLFCGYLQKRARTLFSVPVSLTFLLYHATFVDVKTDN